MENNNHLPALNLKSEDLPLVISKTINGVAEIDKKIKQSEEKAIKATESAKIAKNKKAGWSLFGSNKKEAIEALQIAVSDQADALYDSIETNKEQFDNQKKMIKSIQYLFGLGVANMAANRTVVRELEMKLRNASKEELSELAKAEIEGVILQLRAQEDMWKRIENNDAILREHKVDIDKTTLSLESIKRSTQTAIDTISQLRNEVESLPSKLSVIQKELNEIIENRLSSTTNVIHSLFDNEKTKLSQVFAELEGRFKTLEEKISQEIEVLVKLEDELKTENEAIFNQYKNQLNEELARIEKQLKKKSFFDSSFYKFVIGVSALTALALHYI